MVKSRLTVTQSSKTTVTQGIAIVDTLVTYLLFCNLTVLVLSSLTYYLSMFRLQIFSSLGVLLTLKAFLLFKYTYRHSQALVINDVFQLVYSYKEMTSSLTYEKNFIVITYIKNIRTFLGLNIITGDVCRYTSKKAKKCHFLLLPARLICKDELLTKFKREESLLW